MSAKPLFGFRRFADKEQVREAAAEDLRWEIGAALAAKRALGDDPRIRHGHDGGGNVLTAAFAAHRVVADVGFG